MSNIDDATVDILKTLTRIPHGMSESALARKMSEKGLTLSDTWKLLNFLHSNQMVTIFAGPSRAQCFKITSHGAQRLQYAYQKMN